MWKYVRRVVSEVLVFLFYVPGPSTTVQEVDVTGVDLSEVMISAAQQRYPKARWLVGNALALPQLLASSFFLFCVHAIALMYTTLLVGFVGEMRDSII